jgi:aspartyl-tRNA(Asn)/glutamyl-tRNA(Gln) amidotransferase subunit B
MPGRDHPYQVVIGLEVHAQLMTESKLFSGDSTRFGAPPNTQVSPISLGHPGTLPVLNKKAIELALKAGLSCGSQIQRRNYFARKNYFYPDLPKGYQISQHTAPICRGGSVRIRIAEGYKEVPLNRIHLEEDAGKSLHDLDPDYTGIDLNRAGVPLIEIVTEPCLESADEAYSFLAELRKILRYLEVCDGNMEEGSLRCDANISVRRRGETRLGTKVEIKNLNSLRHLKQALLYEGSRLTQLLEQGEPVVQQTRGFDASRGISFAMRNKEEEDDYRYFADPDIPPFIISDGLLERVRAELPELPEERVARYTREFSLPEYDARLLCSDKDGSDYFDRLCAATSHYKAAANWLLGPVRSWLHESGKTMLEFPVSPEVLAKLVDLADQGILNFSVASGRILPELIRQPQAEPFELAGSMNLVQTSDTQDISSWVDQVLAKMPEKVAEYRKGKKGLIGLFVGEVKRISRGKADPGLTNQLLREKLDQP